MTETNVKKLERLEQEIAEVRENIERETKPKVWEPKKGDRYFYYDLSGGVHETWSTDSSNDSWRSKCGNIFETKDEVLKVNKKQILLTKMHRLAKETNDPIDWRDVEQLKWCLELYGGQVHRCGTAAHLQGLVCFTDKDVLEQFIQDNRDDLHLLFEGD